MLFVNEIDYLNYIWDLFPIVEKEMHLDFNTFYSSHDYYSHISLIKVNDDKIAISDNVQINAGVILDASNGPIILNEHVIIESGSIIISTTGKTSREIFEIREKYKDTHEKDFLTVGSMGHCSSIALGIALSKPNRKIFCIDGDGSMLMHFGSLSSIISLKPANFRHILLNNEVHESVGGQETAAKYLDFSKIIETMGVINVYTADNLKNLKKHINQFISCIGPAFLEVKIRPGSRDDLGRPTIKPIDNKADFMSFLEN